MGAILDPIRLKKYSDLLSAVLGVNNIGMAWFLVLQLIISSLSLSSYQCVWRVYAKSTNSIAILLCDLLERMLFSEFRK